MARKESSKGSGPRVVAGGARSPITLRLGDLEPAVEERAAGAALGSIVRRDLARYYRLIGDYRIEAGMGVDEADVMVHALRGFDEAAYQYVWAAVDDFLASREHVMEHLNGVPIHHRFSRVKRELLTVLLRQSSRDNGQNMAMLDAVERYWSRLRSINLKPFTGWIALPEGYDPDYPVTDAEMGAFVDVGLIRPEAAERYRKERDDPARLKTRPEQEPTAAENEQDVETDVPEPIRRFSRRDDV